MGVLRPSLYRDAALISTSSYQQRVIFTHSRQLLLRVEVLLGLDDILRDSLSRRLEQ